MEASPINISPKALPNQPAQPKRIQQRVEHNGIDYTFLGGAGGDNTVQKFLAKEGVQEFLSENLSKENPEAKVSLKEGVVHVQVGEAIKTLAFQADSGETDSSISQIVDYLQSFATLGPLILKTVQPLKTMETKPVAESDRVVLTNQKPAKKAYNWDSLGPIGRFIRRSFVSKELRAIDYGKSLNDSQVKGLNNFFNIPGNYQKLQDKAVKDSLTGLLKYGKKGITSQDSHNFNKYYEHLKGTLPELFTGANAPLAHLNPKNGLNVIDQKRQPLVSLVRAHEVPRENTMIETFIQKTKSSFIDIQKVHHFDDNGLKNLVLDLVDQRESENRLAKGLGLDLNDLDIRNKFENNIGILTSFNEENNLKEKNYDVKLVLNVISVIQEVNTDNLFSQEQVHKLVQFFLANPDLLPLFKQMVKGGEGLSMKDAINVSEGYVAIIKKEGDFNLFGAEGPLVAFSESRGYKKMREGLLMLQASDARLDIAQIGKKLMRDPKAQRAFNEYMTSITYLKNPNANVIKNVNTKLESMLSLLDPDSKKILEDYHRAVKTKMEEKTKADEKVISDGTAAVEKFGQLVSKFATPEIKEAIKKESFNEIFRSSPNIAENFAKYQEAVSKEDMQQVAIALVDMAVNLNNSGLQNSESGKAVDAFIEKAFTALKQEADLQSKDLIVGKLGSPFLAPAFNSPEELQKLIRCVEMDSVFAIVLDDFLNELANTEQQIVNMYASGTFVDMRPPASLEERAQRVATYFANFNPDDSDAMRASKDFSVNAILLSYQENFQAITDSMQTALLNNTPPQELKAEFGKLLTLTKEQTGVTLTSEGPIDRHFNNVLNPELIDEHGFMKAASGGFSYKSEWIETSNGNQTERLRPFVNGKRHVELSKNNKKINFDIDLDLSFISEPSVGKTHVAIAFVEDYMTSQLKASGATVSVETLKNTLKVFSDEEFNKLEQAAKKFVEQSIDNYNRAIFALNHPDISVPGAKLEDLEPRQQAA